MSQEEVASTVANAAAEATTELSPSCQQSYKQAFAATDAAAAAAADKQEAKMTPKLADGDDTLNKNHLSQEEDEGKDEDNDNSESSSRRQPNLRKTKLKKPDLFDQLEQEWVAQFNERFAVPVTDYDKHSQMGKINWKQFALVENEANICKGHHALCPLVRCRSTGQLYRCKIITAKRIHFNLTTLGFKKKEYAREIRNSLMERRFLFSFQHPFIRNGLGYFLDDNFNVGAFVEEFPNGTLLDYYHKNSDNKIVSQFTETQVKYLAAQILLALEYLHCIGCVHRDIQAGNILIDKLGFIKLTDFAITARMPPNQAKLYDVTCFRYYAAPEFFSGKGYDYGVDFYALGLMLYELLMHECFTDQEEIFDCDGSVDWGIMPQDLAELLANNKNYGQQQQQQQSEAASAEAAAAAAASINADAPSIEAREFVDDCLIHDPSYRPDRHCARFYDWFNNIDFSKLFNKAIELPWKPDKLVSYQADIDEEYPLELVLDKQPMPQEFEQHKHLF